MTADRSLMTSARLEACEEVAVEVMEGCERALKRHGPDSDFHAWLILESGLYGAIAALSLKRPRLAVEIRDALTKLLDERGARP